MAWLSIADIPCSRGAFMNSSSLHVGDWVVVRSKEEILATLDANAQLDSLPFMPEMLEFCGKTFEVYKRAHKTCDTVNDYKGRRLEATVHLAGARCNGYAHEGCEAGCLIFWKEEWLKWVSAPNTAGSDPLSIHSDSSSSKTAVCTEDGLIRSVIRGKPGLDPTYVCQATQVPSATMPLPWWQLSQYVEDYTSGNASLTRMLCGFIYISYVNISNLGIGIGQPMRWLYDAIQRIAGGVPYPRRTGLIPQGERTPQSELHLTPGEWVRVKSYADILATLDTDNKNRGLYFDAEYVPYCGRVFRVLRRVTTIVNEKNGKLLQFKTPAVILEDVFCRSRYSHDRMFCPRSIYAYWREIWLERVEGNALIGSDRSHKCHSEVEQVPKAICMLADKNSIGPQICS